MFRFQNKIWFFFLLPQEAGGYNFRSVRRSRGGKPPTAGIKRDHIMERLKERPGEKLKHARERLRLTYRDVEKASQEVARRRASDEFAIALSRLADIENKGTVPTIFRLYSLCAIYRLNLEQVLGWYGIPLELLPAESMQTPLNQTHTVDFAPASRFTVNLPADS